MAKIDLSQSLYDEYLSSKLPDGENFAVHLSDANAATLLADGLSFAAHDNITVDAGDTGHTHLSNSLKGLEKLSIDSVNLMGGAGASDTIMLTNGESGDMGLNALAQGAPSFTANHDVTLEIGASDAHLLNAAGVDAQGDAIHFANAGIDHISLDIHGDVASHSLDTAITTGSLDGINLGDLHAVSGGFQAGGINHGLELEVGNAGGTAVHLSDANAATLLADGLSFAAHDNITVDAHSTHLSNSLKDLEKLHVDSVSLAVASDAAAQNTIHLNLYTSTNPGTMADILVGGLPDFTHSADVTLDLLNTANIQGLSGSNIEADLTRLEDSALVNSIVDHGIDHLAIHEALNVSGGYDWMHLNEINTIHGFNNGLSFELDIKGGTGTSVAGALSLDDAIHQEFITTGHTAPSNFDDLIQALSESGINDFVIEKGNVEITDGLASALVDSGMVHALPGANLILDATADVATYQASDYARLSTSLKSMADLGVDEVLAGSAHKVYMDLGLPVNDVNAMNDISALLASLDPNDAARAIAQNASGAALGVSMVMSDQMMQNIVSHGGFSIDDLRHLQHLGVTEIAVLTSTNGSIAQESLVAAQLVTSQHALDFTNAQTSPAPTPLPVAPIMPDVKVIGIDDPLHPILDPTHITHP